MKSKVTIQDVFYSTLYVFIVTVFIATAVMQIREYGIIDGIFKMLTVITG